MKEIRVGFGRTDITPDCSVPLAGFGNVSKRMSTGYLDRIYTTCIAISDPQGSTVLLFGSDLCTSSEEVTEAARTAIHEAAGIEKDHIFFSASHTHSGPATNYTSAPGIPEYNRALVQWSLEAALAALADRKPARIFAASTQAPGLSFVRHYILEDGTYAGDNYGHFKLSPIAGHESQADTQLQLVKFARQGGEDVVIANFQGHPSRTGGSKKFDISADVVGAFRSAYEEKAGCRCVYFTGGSGNLNTGSRIESEKFQGSYLEWGQALAGFALEAQFHPVHGEKVAVRQRIITLAVNHDKEEYLDVCREISHVWAETGDGARCRQMGAPYGIHSPYHSNAVLARAEAAAEEDMEVDAVRVGDIAFAVAPYEMFDTNGMEIKSGSPFDTTIIMTCANQARSYIPSALNWEHGSYAVDMTRYARGTAELLVKQYLEMLGELYAEDHEKGVSL